MSFSKRVFDLIFASFLLFFLAPFLTVLLVYVLIRQGRPLFYISERMTTPDRSFGMWKLRTMRVVKHDSGVSGGNKTGRVTPTGAWLRARRFDELPQLWNIIKGDLSFVGPRPPLREYAERFPQVYDKVLKSRPGVTGLATLYFHKHEERLLGSCESPGQTDDVYARICVPRKAQLDLIYSANQSLCFDVKLIFQTLTMLMKSRRGTKR
ncbi:MAG: sugar transferase [Sulfitobacter sp.]